MAYENVVLEDLDDDEFEEYANKIANTIEEARTEALRIHKERDRRVLDEDARKMVKGMSDAQRAALAQVAAPDGIESQEKVGGEE